MVSTEGAGLLDLCVPKCLTFVDTPKCLDVKWWWCRWQRPQLSPPPPVSLFVRRVRRPGRRLAWLLHLGCGQGWAAGELGATASHQLGCVPRLSRGTEQGWQGRCAQAGGLSLGAQRAEKRWPWPEGSRGVGLCPPSLRQSGPLLSPDSGGFCRCLVAGGGGVGGGVLYLTRESSPTGCGAGSQGVRGVKPPPHWGVKPRVPVPHGASHTRTV